MEALKDTQHSILKNPSHKNGFTLVELSIVLVIIGLITGGILAAQSMITTAKIQSQVKQLSQYDISIENFISNYKALPGDNETFNEVGDNNNEIDGEHFNEDYEIGHVWTDLTAAGRTNDGNSYVPYVSGTISFGPINAHMPKAKLGTQGTGIIIMQNISGQASLERLNGFYLLAKMDQMASQQVNIGGTSAGFAYTATEAMALDSKLDDGIGSTGNMLVYNNLSGGGNDSTYYPAQEGLHYVLMVKYAANSR